MITEIELENGFGQIKIPACYAQLNDNQQVVAVGADFNSIEWQPESKPGIKVDKIGKLAEWKGMFGMMLTKTLAVNGWNFEKYPNPELILLNDEREGNEKI